MKFFKENSYDIVRLYINNIGITIFSLMLYLAAGNIAKDAAGPFNLAISIFSIGFLMALVYCAGWDFGAKDKIHIDSGKMTPDKNKGLKLALFADVPNFVFAILALLFLALNMLSGVEAFKVVSAIFDAIMRLTMSMYIGVIQSISDVFALELKASFLLESSLFILLPVFVVFATTLGYRFGVENKRLLDIFRKSKEEDKL